jgi:hypothetical protein
VPSAGGRGDQNLTGPPDLGGLALSADFWTFLSAHLFLRRSQSTCDDPSSAFFVLRGLFRLWWGELSSSPNARVRVGLLSAEFAEGAEITVQLNSASSAFSVLSADCFGFRWTHPVHCSRRRFRLPMRLAVRGVRRGRGDLNPLVTAPSFAFSVLADCFGFGGASLFFVAPTAIRLRVGLLSAEGAGGAEISIHL